MKVISKLAEIDFQFGAMRRDRNLLVIESHPDAKLASTVYVSPDDVLNGLKRLIVSPGALLFLLALPVFVFRWRRGEHKVAKHRDVRRDWPTV